VDGLGAGCDHGQRRQAIVQSVLAEVFQGKLRPGQHLVTQRLAERFGVSHTPVREAMITLAGIGIVDLVPNRGAIVRSVSEIDVREICQVRKVLECEAVRLSCGRIPLAALHEISASLQQINEATQQPAPQFIQEARRVDSALHDLIAESTGNRFLTQELNRLKMLFRAFRDVAWEHDEARDDYHRLAEEGREHAAIVEALLARDARLAAKAMSRHIRSGLKYWSRALPMGDDEQIMPQSA
jgi:DNA-binding GntR family transcriptional regulator